MRDIKKLFGDLLVDEGGASAVEYGLLVAAIAAVIVVVIFALGGLIRDVFQTVCSTVDSGVAGASASC